VATQSSGSDTGQNRIDAFNGKGGFAGVDGNPVEGYTVSGDVDDSHASQATGSSNPLVLAANGGKNVG
jgi:hypothetical protein